jgi:hypothetical protein
VRLWWVFFSEVPPSLLLILLIFDVSYLNFFVPPLLIPPQTACKAASPEGALFFDERNLFLRA